MKREIIKAQENCVVESRSQNILPEKLKTSISNALANITEEKALRLISQSIENEGIRKKAKEIINPETIYIAKIRHQNTGAFEAGLLNFMVDSKTGENLGVLVNEKHRSQGFVAIEKMSKSVDMSAEIATIALQKQLAQMAEVIDDVRRRVVALQEGQDKALKGRIEGMHDQMIQMRDATTEAHRKALAIQAITVLNDVRGQIGVAISDVLEKMPYVPNGKWKIVWEIAKDKTFLQRAVESYDRIEALVCYYLTATQLLGYAYAFLGEKASFEDVFCPRADLLNRTLTQKLEQAENLFIEKIEDAWYKNPYEYMLKIKAASQELFLPNEDVIEIEVSGRKLLEAVKDEEDN